MEKRRNCSLFSTLFYIYIFLPSGVKLHIHLLNVVVLFIVFLTLSTLCQGTDISKYFSEPLGIRDNESRLYFLVCNQYTLSNIQMYFPCKQHIFPYGNRLHLPIYYLRKQSVNKLCLLHTHSKVITAP